MALRAFTPAGYALAMTAAALRRKICVEIKGGKKLLRWRLRAGLLWCLSELAVFIDA
jgi:hypothetical protein